MKKHKQYSRKGTQGHRRHINLLPLRFPRRWTKPSQRSNQYKNLAFGLVCWCNRHFRHCRSLVFSDLLKNPRVMKKLQHEQENIVGKTKLVDEVDLDMVIKETLRLHPVAPLLLPQVSTEAITINGYYIRNKSRVIENVWAIGRDPKIWSDNVEAFYPERFVNSNEDLRGKDFQLIPFGSGRRGCPGMQLGLIAVKLVIAQLMHCINWELPLGVSPAKLDVADKFGLLIPRANHLLALPSCCLAVN